MDFSLVSLEISINDQSFRTKDNPLARSDKRVARSRYGLSVKGHNMHGFTVSCNGKDTTNHTATDKRRGYADEKIQLQ